MSRKLAIKPYYVVTAGDMSSSITSTETTTESVDEIVYEISWTGSSPIGTITVEIQVLNTWDALDFGTNIDVSGNSGSHKIIISKKANKIRLKYNRTSGTGALDVVVSGNTVGA